MSQTTLFILIAFFIILLIIFIHIYDRYLVKQIKVYEKRMEDKGIFKRHFIENKSIRKKIIIKCINCSKKFSVKHMDIPVGGRVVKCSFCSSTWRQMPN